MRPTTLSNTCIAIVDISTLTKKKSNYLTKKHTDRVPIVVTHTDENIKLKELKYMVPKDLTVSAFLQVIRSKCKNLLPTEALFLFITNKHVTPRMNSRIFEIYDLYNTEGFLLITIQKENTFG
tara:strand:+ start:39 stop:407 length:369 start_codon:yes stop_codon:yes gene_type:complete